MKPYIFVYGTLTKSHPRIHQRLMGSTRFIGRGSIAGTLYDLGRYPGAYRRSGQRARVSGELYELDGPHQKERLKALDQYEGREFRRARVLVRLNNGEQHLAWGYLLAEAPPRTARQVRSGVYRRRRAA